MTMHTIFFKENEGIFPDPINGSPPEAPDWSAVATANGNYALKSFELSGGKNQQLLAKRDSTPFNVFPGDCRTAKNGAKTIVPSPQPAASMQYLQGQFTLGLGQPPVCPEYPYNVEKWYGVYPAQIEGQHMMVPLSTESEGGGPVFVNAKQYNAIMRRRRSRAKAESKINEEMKTRKPYMHLSRHLHAVRRQRGSGGRFLRTRSEKAEQVQPPQYSGSGSTSPAASEVTSYLYHHFELGDVGNYLKV